MNSNPASVLVIEPHPLMRDAICTAINTETDLIVTGQAASCLEAFNNWPILAQANGLSDSGPDIILLSFGYPDQNELEIIASLRKLLPETAILALTNAETEWQTQAALNAGAQKVLHKSEHRTVLIAALRSLRSFRVDSHKQDFENSLDHYLSGVEGDQPHA